jgi:hypothetical protein
MVIKMTNKYAKVENGVVTNMIVADSEWASEQGLVLCPDYDDAGQAIGMGATYENWQFTAYVAPEPTPVAAPTKEELMAQLAVLSAQIQALTPAEVIAPVVEPVVEAVTETISEPVVEVTPEPTPE